MFIYNTYFLIIEKKLFSIISIQINNIFILIIKEFFKLNYFLKGLSF